MTTTTLTPAQSRMLDTVRDTRVELRQSRNDGAYYWESNGARIPAPTGRVLDKLADMGLVRTRRENVRVVGMNVPRVATVAYIP